TRSGTAISIKGVTSVSRWKQKTTCTRSFATWSGTPCVPTSWSERNRGVGRVCAVWSAKTRRFPSSRRGLCDALPIGCNLSTNRKRKPKWPRCVAASVAVGPLAILTGSGTRPSDWGWNRRFGPVEGRRNNYRLVTVTCIIWILQIWWLSPSPPQIWWLSPSPPCHLHLPRYQRRHGAHRPVLAGGVVRRRAATRPDRERTVRRDEWWRQRPARGQADDPAGSIPGAPGRATARSGSSPGRLSHGALPLSSAARNRHPGTLTRWAQGSPGHLVCHDPRRTRRDQDPRGSSGDRHLRATSAVLGAATRPTFPGRSG